MSTYRQCDLYDLSIAVHELFELESRLRKLYDAECAQAISTQVRELRETCELWQRLKKDGEENADF